MSNNAFFINIGDKGRKLSYMEYGDPFGFPVFYFHGFPGSRLDLQLADGQLKDLGIRAIALDRPGMGLSDFQKGRALLDWPDDVEAAADFLRIPKFSVFGLSGGAPYAAACAFKIPHRLHSAVIVSGIGPLSERSLYKTLETSDRILFHLSKRALWLAKLIYKATFKDIGKLLDKIAKTLPECDRQILQDENIRKLTIDTIKEAKRNGVEGMARDFLLYCLPWGFELKDINFPVKVFHGEMDKNAPIEMGRHYQKEIPLSKATFYPGEGHFSLFINRLPELIKAL